MRLASLALLTAVVGTLDGTLALGTFPRSHAERGNEEDGVNPMLDHNDHVVTFVDDYLHDVLDDHDATYVEQHCEACRICKPALEDARKRFTALQTLPAVEPSQQLIQATLQRIDTHEH